jgi:hypothetical protein
MLRKRRGISEMVAVILVLVIVTTAGALLYRSSLVTLSTQYSSLTGQISDETIAANQRFEIVNVQKTGQKNVNVYLLNYSPEKTVNVTIISAYISDLTSTKTLIKIDFRPGTILEKDIVTSLALTTSDFNFDTRNIYKIQVVSQRGVINDYTWKCP